MTDRFEVERNRNDRSNEARGDSSSRELYARTTRQTATVPIPRGELEAFAEIYVRVTEFFDNAAKTSAWFRTPNPLLGEVRPIEMLLGGRACRLLQFVRQTDANLPEATQPKGDVAQTRKMTKANYAPFNAMDYLKDEHELARYLSAALEDPNTDVFLLALSNVAKGRRLPKRRRESVAVGTKPKYEAVSMVLEALDLRLIVTARDPDDAPEITREGIQRADLYRGKKFIRRGRRVGKR